MKSKGKRYTVYVQPKIRWLEIKIGKDDSNLIEFINHSSPRHFTLIPSLFGSYSSIISLAPIVVTVR